jgi:hypothetical protein
LHARPQSPQLLLSALTSMHPPAATQYAWLTCVHVHDDAKHAAPAPMHARSQSPQWPTSFETDTHRPPHTLLGAMQPPSGAVGSR